MVWDVATLICKTPSSGYCAPSPRWKAYLPKLGKWLRAWYLSAAFWQQTWRQKTMPHTASGNHSIDYSMPCLASFFGAMSGVKKLSNLIHAITCQASAYKASELMITIMNNINNIKNKTQSKNLLYWSQKKFFLKASCELIIALRSFQNLPPAFKRKSSYFGLQKPMAKTTYTHTLIQLALHLVTKGLALRPTWNDLYTTEICVVRGGRTTKTIDGWWWHIACGP